VTPEELAIATVTPEELAIEAKPDAGTITMTKSHRRVAQSAPDGTVHSVVVLDSEPLDAPATASSGSERPVASSDRKPTAPSASAARAVPALVSVPPPSRPTDDVNIFEERK
jgi:hypothetical protein